MRFTGHVSAQELTDLYATCRAVFYGPIDEDYGFTTVQALAAARPVVTTDDSGGVLEFIEDGSRGAHAFEDAGVGIRAGAGLGQNLLKREGFEALNSEQAAPGLDHLIDEEVLVLALGVELIAEASGEFGEFGGVLVRVVGRVIKASNR